MFDNLFEQDQIFMDNSLDFERNPYTPPKYPLFTIDNLDSISPINLEKNNFESTIFVEQDNNNINTNTNTNANNKNKSTTKGKKRPGRIPKNEQGPDIHSKECEDNIIKKIKTHCMIYLEKQLNKSLKYSLNFSFKKFYKLNTDINEILRKDYNIKLMNMTIKEIYEENSPCKKYDQSVNKKNYDLIREIYDKNEEKETIELLNTKFIDFLNELETKEFIIKEIERKERLKKKDNHNNISYMSKVRNLLENFQEWFTKKLDRNYKSKQNENNE